jgi:hypothetical protein
VIFEQHFSETADRAKGRAQIMRHREEKASSSRLAAASSAVRSLTRRSRLAFISWMAFSARLRSAMLRDPEANGPPVFHQRLGIDFDRHTPAIWP